MNLDYETSRARQVAYEKLGLLDEFCQIIEAKKDLNVAYDAYRLPWEEFLREKVSSTVSEGQPDDHTMGMIEAELNGQQDAIVRLAYKSRSLNGIWARASQGRRKQ